MAEEPTRVFREDDVVRLYTKAKSKLEHYNEELGKTTAQLQNRTVENEFLKEKNKELEEQLEEQLEEHKMKQIESTADELESSLGTALFCDLEKKFKDAFNRHAGKYDPDLGGNDEFKMYLAKKNISNR